LTAGSFNGTAAGTLSKGGVPFYGAFPVALHF
jgi:hypothetical protein